MLLAFANLLAFSKPANDDVIPLEYNEFESDTMLFRSPSIPIHAVIIPEQSIISVTFMYDLGYVSIDITNLVSGVEYSYGEPSSTGGAIIPMPEESGYYLIVFTTASGHIYSGYFSII